MTAPASPLHHGAEMDGCQAVLRRADKGAHKRADMISTSPDEAVSGLANVAGRFKLHFFGEESRIPTALRTRPRQQGNDPLAA